MKNQKTRRLAAVMFTDIVGYTALMQSDEKEAAQIRARHRLVFEEQHKKHHGEIVQYFGDGTLSVFQSGIEAVECAIAMQIIFNQAPQIPLRVGLHIGDIVFDGTEIYGDGVNLASRIESLGMAGAILISGKLNDELSNQNHLSTQSLGFFDLKNIHKPVEVFAVTNEGIKIPDPSAFKAGQKKQSKSIAVLPFVNRSSSEENEYFSDGMTEEIINALAKIKGLKVTSRTSSFFFKNKKIPIGQIGKELEVSTILEGSIRLSGNKMRLTAQLIDVADDFHFWSETFDRSIDDIFAVQDEISLLIADKLREHLGHFNIDDRLVKAPDISVELYKKYLKGRYYLQKLSLADVQQGIAIMEEVIAQEPGFALPYLGINQGYAFLGTMGLIPAVEAFTKAKPFLDKAIELDEDHPECQLNMAWTCAWQNWDLPAAYKHLFKALETRPSDVIYLSIANLLSVEGKFSAAHNYADKTLQIDPFSAINQHFKGFLFYLEEKHEKAIVYYKKSLALNPDLYFPKNYWGQSLILQGKADEALTHFQSMPADPPGEISKLSGLTLTHAALKNTSETLSGIAELETHLQTAAIGHAMFSLISIHTTLGDHEKAIGLIKEAISNKLPNMLLLYTEPILRPLHSHQDFQQSMQELFSSTSDINFSKRKYKKSLFDPDLLIKHKNQLEQLMDTEKPYLDAGLSLRILAEKISLPPNHLSQLLNEGFDKNFAEYINSYRLEAFKSKVADPALRHLTILSLAYDSGFNSKTVFNTFFKKNMGMTPKAYWRSTTSS